MSNLNAFYKMLTTAHQNKNPYQDSLAAIMKATRSELNSLSSDMSWQTWTTEVKSANT